jgi:hypothetical protein
MYILHICSIHFAPKRRATDIGNTSESNRTSNEDCPCGIKYSKNAASASNSAA